MRKVFYCESVIHSFYLPPVSLRLSALQLNAIRPGLLLIINRYQAAQDTGEYSYSDPYYLHPRPGFDFGEFDPQIMSIVCAVGKRLSGRGRRLQLNAIELAICIFAARVTAREEKTTAISPGRQQRPWRGSFAHWNDVAKVPCAAVPPNSSGNTAAAGGECCNGFEYIFYSVGAGSFPTGPTTFTNDPPGMPGSGAGRIAGPTKFHSR